MPYKIRMVIPDTTSCAYYRTILPYEHLRGPLADRGIELETTVEIADEKKADAYVFGRTYDPRVFPTLVGLYEKGARIVWDLDDDLPTVPDWSPAKRSFGRPEIGFLSMCLRMASAVACSTVHLARSTEEHFPHVRDRTTVCENLIDPRPYEVFSRHNLQVNPGPFRVMFTGSATHSGDMEPVIALVDHILESDDDTIVMFYGYWPDKYARCHPHRVFRLGTNDPTSYAPALAMAAPHIGLCPLADCHFNKCKSAIKWMELTCAGAAVIASDMPPFSDVIDDRETGFLESTPGGWIDAYDRLRDSGGPGCNPRALTAVQSEFSWISDSRRRRDWLEFYSSIPDLLGA